jgi:hypothetical protein
MSWNPVNVKYETTCNTREEFECFGYFMKEMKALKENPPPDPDKQLCICGHEHRQHHPTSSVNYTAGHCRVEGCRCKNFLSSPNNPQPKLVDCPVCKNTGKIAPPKMTQKVRDPDGTHAFAAKILRAEGYSFREIARILGYKGPGSILHLVNKADGK